MADADPPWWVKFLRMVDKSALKVAVAENLTCPCSLSSDSNIIVKSDEVHKGASFEKYLAV
jgi:hypothetical protein